MVRGGGDHRGQRSRGRIRDSGSGNGGGGGNHGSGGGRRGGTLVQQATKQRDDTHRDARRRTTPRGTTRNATAATATASATAAVRHNHGSGGSRTKVAREASRANHGSGTRSDATTTTTAAARESRRANHGSSSARGDAFAATTRPSHGANHGSGTRRNPPAVTVATREHRRRTNHGSGARSGSSAPPTGIHGNDQPNEQGRCRLCRVCGCLFRCLGAVLLAVLCCGSCQRGSVDDDAATAVPTATNSNSNSNSNNNRNNNRNRNRSWGRSLCSPCWWLIPSALCCSALLFLVLVRNSTLGSFVTPGSTDTARTLFAGETQRILLPRLARELKVTVAQPVSRGVRLRVYWTSASGCPGLNGPKLELQHDGELDLNGDGFSYDYYNLNPGSYIRGRIDQISGGTYFYLLRGEQSLEDIQTGTNIDPDHWEDTAVLKRYAENGEESDFFYQTSYWKDKDGGDNIYTLVYDNASRRDVSSLDTQTDIVLSTHDLSGYRPSCDNMRHYGDACKIDYSSSQDCVILEAFSVDEKDDQEIDALSEPSAIETNDDRTISLTIESYRDWENIFFFSAAIPLFVSVLVYGFLSLWSCSSALRNNNETNDSEEDLIEPLLPPEDAGAGDGSQNLPPPPATATATATHGVQPLLPPEPEFRNRNLPPPTAPHPVPPQQPSAPIEDDVVVVPPENVEVVPK